MRFICRKSRGEKCFLLRGCEPRGQEESLIFDVGCWTGGEITHAKDAKPRRGYGAGCEDLSLRKKSY